MRRNCCCSECSRRWTFALRLFVGGAASYRVRLSRGTGNLGLGTGMVLLALGQSAGILGTPMLCGPRAL